MTLKTLEVSLSLHLSLKEVCKHIEILFCETKVKVAASEMCSAQ